MKLKTIAGVTALVAGMSVGVAQAAEMSAEVKALYEAAKQEGELTWYVSHYTTETAEAIGASFTENYPSVEINVIRATAQVIFQRLNLDIQAGAQFVDVYSTTDNAQFARLKEDNLLETYIPENAAKVLEPFQNFDPDNQFQGTSAAMIVMAYNTDKISEEDAPTSWKDLLDPRFKGKLAFGHPAFSGQVGIWTTAMNKVYGWEFFEQLEKNDPQVGRSINDVLTMLDSGERQVAHIGDGPFRRKAADGAAYGTVFPSDGAVMTIGGTAVLANAPHPNAAKLFVNFLMDIPPQEIRVERDWGISIRPEVAPSPGGKSAADVPTISVSVEELQGLPELREKWRNLFGS